MAKSRLEPRFSGSSSVPILSSAGPIPASVMKRREMVAKARRTMPRFMGSYLTASFMALVTGAGLHWGGQIEAWHKEQGTFLDFAARTAGFGIERVMLSGHSQLNEKEILAFAGISPKASLPFLDAEAARQKLEQVPLIKSASIRKLYPDGLAVSVNEREAHALWQKDGELSVISLDGAVIDIIRDERFKGLPHVVGEGANLRTREYLALLDQAGPLRAHILAGTLVSGRRWTLKLDNGIDVRLPATGAAEALHRLVQLEKTEKLLSKDIIAIDLRMPDRVVVRLTEEAMIHRSEVMRKRPQRGKGVDT